MKSEMAEMYVVYHSVGRHLPSVPIPVEGACWEYLQRRRMRLRVCRINWDSLLNSRIGVIENQIKYNVLSQLDRRATTEFRNFLGNRLGSLGCETSSFLTPALSIDPKISVSAPKAMSSLSRRGDLPRGTEDVKSHLNAILKDPLSVRLQERLVETYTASLVDVGR